MEQNGSDVILMFLNKIMYAIWFHFYEVQGQLKLIYCGKTTVSGEGTKLSKNSNIWKLFIIYKLFVLFCSGMTAILKTLCILDLSVCVCDNGS